MYRDLAIFAGRAHPQLAKDICHHLRVPLGEVQIHDFANGNTFVKFDQMIRDMDVYIVQPGGPRNGRSVNDALMELCIMIDAARRASAWRVTAVLPYYPYARTDKKDQSRVPITARLVADLLVAAGINRVLTLDLHAGQIQGFFSSKVPVDEVTAFHVLCSYVRSWRFDDLVVVAADLGIAKRARNFAAALNCPVAAVDKRRTGNNDKTEALALVGAEQVAGRRALIIDDEIDTAGSLVNAVDICLKSGATEVYAAATHGMFSKPAIIRLAESPVKEVIITDTLAQDGKADDLPEKITVCSIAPVLGETIRRIHSGDSVGDVYRSLYGDDWSG